MAELGFQNVVNQLRENREKEEEAKAKADQVANNNIESLKKVIERSNTNSEKGREIKAKAEAKLKTLEEEQKQNNAFAVVQSEQVKELKESKEALKIIGERVTAAGGKAEENAEYNEASRKIQEQEFKLRMDSASSKGAKAEIEKERDAFRKKEGTLLQKISLGIGGILGNMKDKAAAVGKGFMSILKGTLFAGLFIALAQFFQSPLFGELVDTITNVILPKLAGIGRFLKENVGKFFGDLFRFVQDPTWENFKKFDIMSVVTTLGAITLLLSPGTLFKGLKLGVKLFSKAIALAGTGLASAGADIGADGKKVKPKGKLGGLKNIGKGLLKGAKFLPGVGLAVTGIKGVFDGVMAGFEEYNKGGTAGDVAREAAAGVVSGLTFGLVSQETISGAFTTIGDKFKTGFDKMKEDTLAGVDKLKDLGLSAKEKLKDVAGGLKEKFDSVSEKVSGFFGDIKGKFTALTDKLPSIKDVGSKIGNFFGFGKKEEKEMSAPLVQFQKERTALVDRIAMLEKRIAEGANTIRKNVDRSRLRTRERQLEELDKSAIARSMGGDAASTNVVAPQAKVTNNTANTNVSSSSSVVQVDPTLQFALS